MSLQRIILAPLLVWGLAFSATAFAQDTCPPKGAKFKRYNAGFEAVLISEGGPARGANYCPYRDQASGTVANYYLNSSDTPLDSVPKEKSGVCPRKGKAEYTIVLTTYQDDILAGPDAAGRCLLKSAQLGEQWKWPSEFKLIGGGGGGGEPGIDLSGTWRCSANGNIPIATLEFTWFNKRYSLKDTPNPQWKKQSGKLNGSGSVSVKGAEIVPSSGPLVSELGIQFISYSVDRGSRALYLSNRPSGLALAQCLPAP